MFMYEIEMKIKDIKAFIYRMKISKNDFFEGIEFEPVSEKETKKNILKWMYNLFRYKNISVEKFSDLLTICNGIEIPIKIKDSIKGLQIINGEVKYTIGYNLYVSHKTDEYDIEKETGKVDTFDIVYNYKILKSGTIMVKSIEFFEKDWNPSKGFVATFSYDKEITKVEFKQDDYFVTMTYPLQNETFDEELAKELLSFFNLKTCLNDAYLLFRLLCNRLQEDASIVVKVKDSKENEMLSKIVMIDGVTKEYSYTQKK